MVAPVFAGSMTCKLLQVSLRLLAENTKPSIKSPNQAIATIPLLDLQ
jgi:hypothetical protein